MLLQLAKHVAAQPLISDTVGVAIAAGLVTVGTAWVTIGMTNRHARRQVEDAAREARRTEAREKLADFVTAGISWAKAHEVMVPVYYKNASDHRFWNEWPNTDSAKKMQADLEAVTRTGAQLRLLVGDDELLTAIKRATELVQDTTPLGKLVEQGSATGGDFDRMDGKMREAFTYFASVKQAFQAVETVAASVVSGELAHHRSRKSRVPQASPQDENAGETRNYRKV